MPTPEPSRFTVAEIAARWSKLYGYEYTPALIVRMREDGQLKLERETERVYPEGTARMERDVADITGTYKVRYHYYVTREERDRFERENPPDASTDSDREPSPKGRNAYLGLIGVLAEWLSELDKLTVEKPHTGASQIEAKAAEYGASIGTSGSIADKLREARALIGKGAKNPK